MPDVPVDMPARPATISLLPHAVKVSAAGGGFSWSCSCGCTAPAAASSITVAEEAAVHHLLEQKSA